MADTGLTVVGAGVVGLAVAARLAARFPGLVVLERREKPGTETSSRNSEVIHAGLYYPTGSLKARLCVLGNRRVYELAERHGVPHRKTGKLIVAQRGEEGAVEALLERGRANGVTLETLSAGEVRRLEPNVRAMGAISSPSTGIVSAHGLVDLFLHQALNAGVALLRRTELIAVERLQSGYRLTVRTGNGETESFTSDAVVNAAGLDADTVAALAGIDVDAAGYRLHYCKGRYFSASSALRGLVGRLVYPAPGPVGLGVHAVLGLDGRLRFGPDAEYLPDRDLDYSVDAALRPAFAEAVRRILPSVRDEDLEPDIAGIRPKLQGPGDSFRDFVVAEESARGLPGFVNLVGIDSPGLTAAPALAEYVDSLLGA